MSQAFEFRLTIVGNQKRWVYIVPIKPEPIVIGRKLGSDLLLEDQRVSGKHAVLHCTTTECMLADLGSTNGTRLNGKKLTPKAPVTLKTGDRIQIDGFTLDFEQNPDEESIVPKEGLGPELLSLQELVASVAQEPETPSSPPPVLPPASSAPGFDPSQPPPGLTFRSDRLLSYLPSIYHTDFMANFLAIFEAILFPVEWQIDNFDLFLDPGTSPAGFLAWLGNWFGFVFDSTWSEAQRRTVLKEAFSIYSRSGTRWALRRILEIYCGQAVEIDDEAENLPPHTFRVKLLRAIPHNRNNIERLINAHKPAHTTFILELV
jgi:phage tail-like protein